MADAIDVIESGWTHYHKKEYDLAIQELEKAAQDGASAPLAHFRLGFCHRMLGNASQATFHFTRAVELDHDQAHYHRELGRQVAFNGDQLGAQSHFARSLELDPMVPLTFYEAGACLGQQNYFELSLVCYTVCGALCDIAPADYDPEISFHQYILSMNQLERILGAKTYNEITSKVYASLGLTAGSSGAFAIDVSGFRKIVGTIVPQLREISESGKIEQ